MSPRPPSTPADRRWPRWVYGRGTEPDYRFSFANERTFLAWIRTALALLAAGVAVDVVDLDLGAPAQWGLASLLIALGLAAGVVAWCRWAGAERAIRMGRPLPAFGVGAFSILWLAILVAVLLLAGL